MQCKIFTVDTNPEEKINDWLQKQHKENWVTLGGGASCSTFVVKHVLQSSSNGILSITIFYTT